MAYYRLADGRITVNDLMFVPDLMQALGPFMAPSTVLTAHERSPSSPGLDSGVTRLLGIARAGRTT